MLSFGRSLSVKSGQIPRTKLFRAYNTTGIEYANRTVRELLMRKIWDIVPAADWRQVVDNEENPELASGPHEARKQVKWSLGYAY